MKRLACALAAAVAQGSMLQAQAPATPPEMYQAWCTRCHAADGSGKVAEPTVKTVPMDFTDCRIASGEPDADWEQVIAHGGPAAGLSAEMPAFGEFLAPDQLRGLVAYVRAFCAEPGWPHGNLNFPRPLFTEKAFPENEVVLQPAVSHRSGSGTDAALRAIYERRIGKRGHAEIAVPFSSVSGNGSRRQGVGDVAIAGKYVLHADRPGTRIVSGGLELILPTGNDRRGLGAGATMLEPFLAAGATVGMVYLQGSLNVEVPTASRAGDPEVGYNVYVGRDTSPSPSTWTLGFELAGAGDALAAAPQVRKGLTRTGALAAAFGVRVPITARKEQSARWAGYLIWEYLEPVRARR